MSAGFQQRCVVNSIQAPCPFLMSLRGLPTQSAAGGRVPNATAEQCVRQRGCTDRSRPWYPGLLGVHREDTPYDRAEQSFRTRRVGLSDPHRSPPLAMGRNARFWNNALRASDASVVHHLQQPRGRPAVASPSPRPARQRDSAQRTLWRRGVAPRRRAQRPLPAVAALSGGRPPKRIPSLSGAQGRRRGVPL